jgi:large subunit ribosomal protein L25
MTSTSHFVQLAKSLPEPLQRFFARWPPAALVSPGSAATSFQEMRPNPFEFYKHPVTGRLQDPVYSARRQAQLFQLARDHGVAELLPPSGKNPTQRLAHRVEYGLRVKGTGVGQKVKGHIHERHMIAKYVGEGPPWPGRLGSGEMLTIACVTGWRREERPCWKCQSSSRNGKWYVLRELVGCARALLIMRNRSESETGPSSRNRHLYNTTKKARKLVERVESVYTTMYYYNTVTEQILSPPTVMSLSR